MLFNEFVHTQVPYRFRRAFLEALKADWGWLPRDTDEIVASDVQKLIVILTRDCIAPQWVSAMRLANQNFWCFTKDVTLVDTTLSQLPQDGLLSLITQQEEDWL